VQVATGESDRRSGPHCTAVVALLHTSWPGVALAQFGSMGWHVPWFDPIWLSQSCPDGHSPLGTQAPPLQSRASFCALPLHAGSFAVEHGQPSVPTAPVPALVAHAS
jgi:hypothetical protein